MVSDTLPAAQSRPAPLRKPQPNALRLWRRGMCVFAVIAVIVSATAFIPGANSSQQHGPMLTHTITRGELLVTVTEQGTLESSRNTEIKCKVRGTSNTIIWVVDSGTKVRPGDELVRLETLFIDEEISERTKFAHLARSVAERSMADVAIAKLAISEYLEGTFVSAMDKLEKELAVAESRLRTTKNMLSYATRMSKSGYVSELDVEEKKFGVTQAGWDLKITKINIDVLNQFTKKQMMASLEGDLAAAEAQSAADKERADADRLRLERAEEELGYCVVKADRAGIVIYPSGEAWKAAPEIEEGATVHKDQVLLLMPDLLEMQVKVGIHESIVDRVQTGLSVIVTLPDKTLDGKVSTVASVAQPAGWWTGNVVKYDTIIELPSIEGLKPGMSAEVEVILDRHENVLLIPAAAVIETSKGYACWVKADAGPKRRTLELGDSSDMFIVVETGLKEGEKVVLDPLACIEEAQNEAAMTLEETTPREPVLSEF